jgi:hypothetical protein
LAFLPRLRAVHQDLIEGGVNRLRRKGLAVLLALCLVFTPAANLFAAEGPPLPSSAVDRSSGVYEGPLTVNLSSTADSTVYYTLDGSIPTEDSSSGTTVTLEAGYHLLLYRAKHQEGFWEPYTKYAVYKVTERAEEVPQAIEDADGTFTKLVQTDGDHVVYVASEWIGDKQFDDVYLDSEVVFKPLNPVTYTAISGDNVIFGGAEGMKWYRISDEQTLNVYDSNSAILDAELSGNWVVFAEEAEPDEYDLKAFDLDNIHLRPVTIAQGLTEWDPFDIDGDRIVWTVDGSVFVYDLITDTTEEIEDISYPSLLKIKENSLYFYQDDDLAVYDLTDGTISPILSDFPFLQSMELDKAPGSDYVAVRLYDLVPMVAILNARTGGVLYADFEDISTLTATAIGKGKAYWVKEHRAYPDHPDSIDDLPVVKAPIYWLDVSAMPADAEAPEVVFPQGNHFEWETYLRFQPNEDVLIRYTLDGSTPGPDSGYAGTVFSLIPAVEKQTRIRFTAIDFAGNVTEGQSDVYYVENDSERILPGLTPDIEFAVYGSELVYTDGEDFYLYDLASREQMELFSDDDYYGELQFDGRYIVYETFEGAAYYDLLNEKAKSFAPGGWFPVLAGSKVVYVNEHEEDESAEQPFITDLADGTTTAVPFEVLEEGWIDRIAADERYIAVVVSRYENFEPLVDSIRVYDLETEQWSVILTEDEISRIDEMVVAAGSVFYIGLDEDFNETWYRYDLAAQTTERLTEMSETTDLDDLSFDRAGGRYVTALDYYNGRMLLYDVTEGSLTRFGSGNFYPDEPQPAGNMLVFAGTFGLPRNDTDLWMRRLTEDAEAPKIRFNPAPGASLDPVTVSIEVYSDDAASLYYTLDGTDPTPDFALRYRGPFAVKNSAVVKAIAVDVSGNVSPILSAAYVIGRGPLTVNAAPSGGSYQEPVTVALSSNDMNATIYYSTDGSAPSVTWDVYEQTHRLRIESDTVLKFKAVDKWGYESNIVTETYYIDPDAPEVSIDPPAGTYPHDVTVTFDVYDRLGDVKVFYTLDGSEPTEDSLRYEEPFILTESTTVKYFAADGLGNKTNVLTTVYVIRKVPPTGTPEPEEGAANVAVDAPIRYLFSADVEAVNLDGVSLAAAGDTVDVEAELDGRTLVIEHDSLEYATSYTVTIPANTVENEHGVGNEEITWSFTTEAAPKDEDDEESPPDNDDGAPSGSDDGTSGSGQAAAPEQSDGVRMNADGSAVLAGNAVNVRQEMTADGRTMTTAVVDAAALASAIESLSANAGSQGPAKITVELNDGADLAVVDLPASALRAGASLAPGLIISIQTPDAGYDLPAGLIDTEGLAAELGAAQEDLKVTVRMEKVAGAAAEAIQRRAAASGLQMIGTPIEFRVSVEANGQSKEITNFGNTYVSRTIVLTQATNGLSLSAVLIDPVTGEMTFVPAVLTETESGTIMTIKRNGNSIYAIVSGKKTFSDLAGHWAKDDIELLASKLLIKGVSEEAFAPDQAITRAEFAVLLVRGLGLTAQTNTAVFSDVSGEEWFAGAIGTAVEAGLINGFTDGTFRPNATITREEMGVMIARALAFAGNGAAADADAGLKRFADYAAISSWAKAQLAVSVEAGIIAGYTDGSFAPHQTATRAEAAVMLKRLLQYAAFIN